MPPHLRQDAIEALWEAADVLMESDVFLGTVLDGDQVTRHWAVALPKVSF